VWEFFWRKKKYEKGVRGGGGGGVREWEGEGERKEL